MRTSPQAEVMLPATPVEHLLGSLGWGMMRRLFLVLGSITTVFLLSVTLAYACGDKLLALNRSPRFQDFSSSRRASILIYSHMGSPTSSAINDGQLQSALVKAGHQLQTVEERSQLDDALKTGHHDLVLVDLMDAPLVEVLLRSAPSPPLVLLVVQEGTKAENKSVKKQYRFLLKAPDKKGNYLNAIDRALDAKTRRDRTALRATN